MVCLPNIVVKSGKKERELVRQSQSVIDSSGMVVSHLCTVHFRFVSTLVVH